MVLQYKPDLDETIQRFDAFWAGDVLDRPLVCIRAPKRNAEGNNNVGRMYEEQYKARTEADFEAVLRCFEEKSVARTAFLGESIPFFPLSFSPDMFSSFFGAPIVTSGGKEIDTTWVEPIVQDWSEFSGIMDESPEGNYARYLRFMEYAAKYSEGKFLLSAPDMHSNMDALSALRGAMDLCYDLYDEPDEVERALKQVQKYYNPIIQAAAKAGKFDERGHIGWHWLYSKESFATVQCDFAAICGPNMGERYIYPYIQEEASKHTHCSYHFDGVPALPHMENILQIPEIDVVQWLPGAGQPNSSNWIDLLKRIQKAGKGLYINDWSPAEIKAHFKELSPTKVCYVTFAKSEEEAEDLLEYMRKNM